MRGEEIMLGLLRGSLWDAPQDLKGLAWSHEQYQDVMTLAKEQAVAGLVAQGLMDSGVRLERADALEVFGLIQQIRKRNAELDYAVVRFCLMMADARIRIYVMKGQTLAALYPNPGLRQSGDIDFLCHPEDWEKAMRFIESGKWIEEKIADTNSEKHVEWERDGVQYEMHRMLTKFAYPKHQRYWDRVVMPEVLASNDSVGIRTQDPTFLHQTEYSYAVPILPPTINVLYTFVHIFYHLIIEGIGLRQFCDWAMLLQNNVQNAKIEKSNNEKCNISHDIAVLERHLEGIGLKKAFTGLGALLTDYLGFSEEDFPFVISKEDHERAPKLLENILERGNFGHNIHYAQSHGVIHGFQHLWEIGKQAHAFHHYAPAEAWWRIPDMFKWWGIKVWRMARK